MAMIEIERLVDCSECDDCGCSFADGARVSVDGSVVFELVPRADCFGGTSFDDDEICIAILRHMGSPVVYCSEKGGYRRSIISMGHVLVEKPSS